MEKLNIAVVPVTPFEQNCTLIWNEETKSGVVIDPGGDVPRIQQAIEQTGMKVETILLTHGHLDHVGGAMELKEALGVRSSGRTRMMSRFAPALKRSRKCTVCPAVSKALRRTAG